MNLNFHCIFAYHRHSSNQQCLQQSLPSRERCIHITDNTQQCQCPWFVSILLDPYICGQCGHGIHAHVDYVSMVVNHYPPTQCAAYVQKTPLAQRCTCEAQLCDHVAINNLFRHADPSSVLDNFAGNNDTSYSVDAISFSNDLRQQYIHAVRQFRCQYRHLFSRRKPHPRSILRLFSPLALTMMQATFHSLHTYPLLRPVTPHPVFNRMSLRSKLIAQTITLFNTQAISWTIPMLISQTVVRRVRISIISIVPQMRMVRHLRPGRARTSSP
ncbi:uncharacterized protein EV420DRAFT_320575 [Desarmillaria tabescens]|uniref:Uncharacterized protein n=1 Tax=Armillaria tabescens TaxID=1929756 RepID=A0AA39J566_ARMTA|nr:uncharacterized protein EV420DRAFT_320575 [Desarmillaria tabescens]KAK0435431.1 hypothetical protein EV420DRAFT_320575 [Desarmillaria tabescens]